MPSFLNKVFGYKKHEDKDVARPTPDTPDGVGLLDGKYEAIPPASAFAGPQFAKDEDRDQGFSFFRSKLRVSHKSAQRHTGAVPHLTLRLPAPKDNSDSRTLGVVFDADPNARLILDAAVIAAKRLSPVQLLNLIQQCTQAITEHGLDTLGIMHPHWFSASPDTQRKLISLFIHSLTPQTITLPPTPTTPTASFENELRYTRSPHDIAAVLRWGLRHLTLDNGCFGKDNAEWGWYTSFFHAERHASYPPNAFSELLLPQLPASHIELLTAMLSLISSLAARAETNGISGSKLSKSLGIWLLVATRVQGSDDWGQFYARWERAGRVLEHLFLAHLREESLKLRLPTRLQELINAYPYNKGSPTMNDELLARPRFSTRQYDALFVRVETVLTQDAEQPKQHVIQLLLEAFRLPFEHSSEDAHIALWSTLRTLVREEMTSHSDAPQFSRIFVDETMQLLSSIPTPDNVSSPTLLASPISKVMSRKRSSSISKVLERALAKSNGSPPVSPTSPSSPVIADWAQFSLSGFGDAPTTQPLVAVLSQDDDVEVTQPRFPRKSSKSRSRRRRSAEREPSDTRPSPQLSHEQSIVETKLASVHVVQIDEAFIDFWSDAVLDPISADWPTFLLCGLKEIPNATLPVRWLVIEQTYTHEQSRSPSPDGRRGRSPRPSFKSDISGFRINSVFSSARKRFSLFSKSATDLKSGGKSPTTGGFGEILAEEEPPTPPSASPATADIDGNVGLVNMAVGATVSSGATADIADQLKVNEISSMPIVSILPEDPVNASKDAADPVHGAAKAPSVEATLESGGEYNGPSDLSRQSIEQAHAKVDSAADPLTEITPVAEESSDSQPSAIFSSGTAAENSVAEIDHAELLRQDAIVDVDVRPVELVTPPVDSDERPPTEPSAESSADVDFREVAEIVAMPAVPGSITMAEENFISPSTVAVAIDDDLAANESQGDQQLSWERTANVATSTAESAIATETQTQVEPNTITSVIDGDEEVKGVADPTEIPTPTPQLVALVEETPGPDVYAAAQGRAEPVQVPAEIFDDAVLQPVAAELQEAEQSSLVHPTEAPSVVIVPAMDTGARVVSVEAEHAADQVSERVTEETQFSVHGTIVQAALPVPEAKVDVSAGIVPATRDITPADVVPPEVLVLKVDVAEMRDLAAPTPVLENHTMVDETPSPEIAPEVDAPVDVPPTITPEELVEGKTDQATLPEDAAPTVESIPLVEEARSPIEGELPTQVLVEQFSALSIPEIPENVTATRPTVDETIVVEVETASDPLTDDDPEAQVPVPGDVPAEDSVEIAVEASDSEPVEVAPVAAIDPEPEPGAEQAQVSVEESVTSASESIANASSGIVDAQDPIGVEALSNMPVSQYDDDAVDVAADTTHQDVQAADEPASAVPKADGQVEEGQAVGDASEPELTEPMSVDSPPIPAPVFEDVVEPTLATVGAPDEPQGVVADVEPQEDVLVERPAIAHVDVLVQELTVPKSEETVDAEP